MSKLYRRPIFDVLLDRVREQRRFIQVLAGPRQVGKTTLAQQVSEAAGIPVHRASADEPALRDRVWLEAQWEVGRTRAHDAGRTGALLVVDEVQKVTGWSETVKRLWDEDTARRVPLRVLLLGSAPLLMQSGMSESLAGRFETVRVWHWTFREMRDAFNWDLDRYLYFGGYPGAAALASEEDRWAAYVLDSLIETTISRDVLLLTRVDKPALLRQLFRLACELSGQIVSYQKLAGQLVDAGNTTTLAHYLELLAGAGMVAGLQKYSGSKVRQRGSSPKLLALNTGLMTAIVGVPFAEMRAQPELWGRLVETAIGAHLVGSTGPRFAVQYWRERDDEVDYVVRSGRSLAAIEVGSGRGHGRSGLNAFTRRFGKAQLLVVGPDGIGTEEFLLKDPSQLIR